MPASVIPIGRRREGSYVLLEAALPGRPPRNIGVFLLDPETGRAWLRLRRDYNDCADPEDAEVLGALEPHIRDCLAEQGAQAWLDSMEDWLSNAVRVTGRQTVAVDAFSRVLDRLFDE